MTQKAVVRNDGSILLSGEAIRAGYGPGSVVEIILTRAGSLIVAIDTSPPPIDVPFKPLVGGRAQLAARNARRSP